MSPHPARTPPFEPSFHRALRRLRGRSLLRASARLLPWLLLVLLALLLADRLALFGLPVAATVTVLAAILAAVALASAWRSPTGRDAALVLDRRLGTRELLTAAYESTPETHPARAIVRRRAAAALAVDAVVKALPLTSWRSWRPAALGLAAVLLAGLLPPLREKAAAAPTAPDPAVEAAAEALEDKLAELAGEAARLDRPEAAEALERLQQLADDMRTGALPTVEDALVALNKTEDALESRRGETPEGGGLGELVDDMAAEPLSADLAKAMDELDREAIRQALERMAGALSPSEARAAAAAREIERLAERMEKLAEALSRRGDGELAELVAELAEALRKGDLARAEELLRSELFAQAMEAVAGMCNGESLDAELAELLQTARYLLGKAGPGPLQQGEGRPAALSRSGPHPGTSSTNREDEGYETGSPILRDRQTSQATDRQGEFEALYDSRLVAAEEFEDLVATGQVGEEGEMLSQEGRALGADTGASLPLRPFGAGAAGAPERAVDLESVPLGYRDLVRSYFGRNDKDGKDGGGDR